ncbi:MAG: 16S rRNA (cytidine(1402)-2'-O)-methyltransferase [Anaerolineae bacterium]|nr:MAG: 16S rRNA (cytidine(1402)-2'-O)-methyltransferase [Anaerolineae bacterium]
MGTLYLIATPIGNLEDITFRAVRLLNEVEYIVAEDTRQTAKLLSHYNIHPRNEMISLHDHSRPEQIERIVRALAEGDVALLSDAGTPLINDPGFELVRRALEEGHRVVPVPGPSAPLAALVASGLPTDAFLYLGYLPRKSAQRRRLLQQVADLRYTLIVLETPHRLLDALRDIQAELGDRLMAVGRELTKLHEEILRGKVSEILSHFEHHAPRGEFTLVIAGAPEASRWPRPRLLSAIEQALQRGEPPSEAARRLAEASGWPRREVYQLLHERKTHESG